MPEGPGKDEEKQERKRSGSKESKYQENLGPGTHVAHVIECCPGTCEASGSIPNAA